MLIRFRAKPTALDGLWELGRTDLCDPSDQARADALCAEIRAYLGPRMELYEVEGWSHINPSSPGWHINGGPPEGTATHVALMIVAKPGVPATEFQTDDHEHPLQTECGVLYLFDNRTRYHRTPAAARGEERRMLHWFTKPSDAYLLKLGEGELMPEITPDEWNVLCRYREIRDNGQGMLVIEFAGNHVTRYESKHSGDIKLLQNLIDGEQKLRD